MSVIGGKLLVEVPARRVADVEVRPEVLVYFLTMDGTKKAVRMGGIPEDVRFVDWWKDHFRGSLFVRLEHESFELVDFIRGGAVPVLRPEVTVYEPAQC